MGIIWRKESLGNGGRFLSPWGRITRACRITAHHIIIHYSVLQICMYCVCTVYYEVYILGVREKWWSRFDRVPLSLFLSRKLSVGLHQSVFFITVVKIIQHGLSREPEKPVKPVL